MKRSVALVLTVIIFAAIAVCFLRPTSDLNPDFGYSFQANPGFGYADKFDGQYQKIELEGNSEYFEETALLYVDPADPYIAVRMRPKKPYFLTLGTPEAIESEEYSPYRFSYKDFGFIERRVGDEWLYCGETAPSDRIFDRGHSDNANNALAWNGNSRYGFCYPIVAPIFDTPGEYRFTLNFREVVRDEVGNLTSDVGDERSVSFCYTVPEVTEMTFDVVSANIIWSEETPDRRALRLTLRLNHGTPAPYMRFGGYSPPMHEENGLATYSMSVDSDKSEYTADIHFAENSDGSGKQYDLTLNLRFK